MAPSTRPRGVRGWFVLAVIIVATPAIAVTWALAAPQEEQFIPEEARINVTHCHGPEPSGIVIGWGGAGVFVAAAGMTFLLREVLRKPAGRRRRPAAR